MVSADRINVPEIQHDPVARDTFLLADCHFLFQSNPGIVTCLENHPHRLETGQFLTFREVNGMSCLNGSTHQITGKLLLTHLQGTYLLVWFSHCSVSYCSQRSAGLCRLPVSLHKKITFCCEGLLGVVLMAFPLSKVCLSSSCCLRSQWNCSAQNVESSCQPLSWLSSADKTGLVFGGSQNACSSVVVLDATWYVTVGLVAFFGCNFSQGCIDRDALTTF